jgi:hydroxymethylbilane synthase
MKLKMGTRGSALALAQAGQLAQALARATPGLEVETVVIKTSGDKFSAANPEQPAAIGEGAKGLFVKEIEEALLEGRVDFAVHSGKDLPAALADGLEIGAYPKREDPRDAFVAPAGAALASLKAGARVATASLRRQAQLKLARPDLAFVTMRGNVDTRLKKLAAGACEGLLLAEAGLRRLGRADVAREILPTAIMLPAPAQGALAVETRRGDEKTAQVVRRLDDGDTRLAVEFERAVMAAVGGGCSTPLGALASLDGGGVRLELFLSEMDGSRPRRLTRRCDDRRRRDEFVGDWAAELRAG